MSQVIAQKDFFISYTHADKTWAEWIAFHLEEAGFTTVIQAWDFRPGHNFVLEVDTASKTAQRIIAVLSPDYFASDYTAQEWAVTFRRDPRGVAGVLLPIRVQPCNVEGLLGSIVYIDLVNLDEQEARKALLEGIRRERVRPSSVPFPTEVRTPAAAPAFPSTLPTIWTVPYRRNPYFTGREGELVSLANSLSTGATFALTQSLSGLGGIGKTQLAVEYAYRFRDRYNCVLWAGADSRETLIADCTQLVEELKLPEKEERDQNQIVVALQRWLRDQQHWLLILDNVEDLGVVNWFLPAQYQGAVLLTTRRQVTEPMAQALELGPWPENDAMLFLLKRTKILTFDLSLDDAAARDIAPARTITQALGNLPLALDQAGAYILETQCGFANYLDLFQKRQAELLRRRAGKEIPTDHPESVATTFTLNFQRVQQRSEVAAELLRVCAFLAPDDIGEEIFVHGASKLGPLLQSLGSDGLLLNQAIEVLRTFSLIKRDPEKKTLTIHRLVQAVLQDTMSAPDQEGWIERVTAAINAVFPHVEYTTWSQCERLVPHALTCAIRTQSWKSTNLDLASVLSKTASYLYGRVQYAEAKPLYQRALRIYEQALGPDHPGVATSLDSLASVYREQGKYAEAEPLYLRALHIRERVLGPDHPDVASSLNSLALLYYEQSMYIEAEPLYLHALPTKPWRASARCEVKPQQPIHGGDT
ncbi:MAG: FxSxx-COOH system tetratricopeptide repeat protein [Ktedonobacteraceae bacterium]